MAAEIESKDGELARLRDAIVVVIDDDLESRTAAERVIGAAGFRVRSHAAAVDFLRAGRPDAPACVVLDVWLPGMSGLDLQKELARAGVEIPLIFVTSHGDIPTSVEAMKGGAVEFLTKPFRKQALLDAIRFAIRCDRLGREQRSHLAALRRHYDLLTPRECEVMGRVVSGRLNKQIAAELGTGEKTIKFHRANIMKKMEAGSLAELVLMASSLERAAPGPFKDEANAAARLEASGETAPGTPLGPWSSRILPAWVRLR